MREKGCSEEDLFSFLSKKKGEDTSHDYILSSMCTIPHPVAVRAHNLFMETNLGDPGLFPGTSDIEQALVSRLGILFHEPRAYGYSTSGGTESNIQALRIAKTCAKKEKPNVILPESAHFSFKKACDMLCVEARRVPLDDQFRMDPDAAATAIDENTCCLVGVAGSTEYGMIDPIEKLGRIARDHDIFFHVDAAFGGLVIPFLESPPPFDFAIPGVSSVAVDPHKMGMSTIPAGCLLVREKDMLCALSIDTPYLSVKQEFTLAGTRPGGPVAGALAVIDYLGREGMEAVVRGCMKNTSRLIEGLETFGIERIVTPDVNVATFRSPGDIAPPWRVSWTRQGHLRIVCMPHVHRDIIERFISEIGDAYAKTSG
jgi:tyrosine decarboxylase / aspartate 1-decarboxylase